MSESSLWVMNLGRYRFTLNNKQTFKFPLLPYLLFFDPTLTINFWEMKDGSFETRGMILLKDVNRDGSLIRWGGHKGKICETNDTKINLRPDRKVGAQSVVRRLSVPPYYSASLSATTPPSYPPPATGLFVGKNVFIALSTIQTEVIRHCNHLFIHVLQG